MNRDQRQAIGVEAYKNSKGCGTLNWCTGMGKTRASTDILRKMTIVHGDFHFIVIVPTSPLRDQWSKILTDLDYINFSVLTIQGLTLQNQLEGFNMECKLLIIDEIHKIPTEKFIRVFDIISYKYILGLTATFERLDGKEEIISRLCPVIDTIKLEEARRNGWVADYIEYCIGVEFNNKDKEEYDNLNKAISKYMAYFDTDYDNMLGCCSRYNRSFNGKNYIGAEEFINNNPDIRLTYQDKNGEDTLVANTLHQKIQIIISKANICRQMIADRKEYTDKAQCKIEATLEAIEYLNMKTVTFGTNTSVSDSLTERLGTKARSFHSNIESQIISLPNKKGIIKPTKIGKDRLLKMILEDFANDVFPVLNTAKKADLGLDVPGLRLGIEISRTTDPGVHDQRKGRIVRIEMIDNNGELIQKEAIFLNLYVKGTKDETNLKYMLKNARRVRWINSLKEIKV